MFYFYFRMMETYTRVPDILDLNFDNDAHFPAFPDIDLRDEDFNSLQELDIEHSFFHQVEQLKPEQPAAESATINTTTAIIPTDMLYQSDMDDSCCSTEDCLSNAEYLSMTCSRGEKRPFTADTDDLSDLDNSDKLRRDCMWSSGPGGLHKFYRPEETASPAVAMAVTQTVPFLLSDDLGLTPPTSYIHQYIEQFQEVLTNSTDDVCSVSSGEDSDWSSIANESDMDQCLEVPSPPPSTTTITSTPAFSSLYPNNSQESRNLSSGDHSYYTSMNESNFPTPPESSDDEDEATKEKLGSKTAAGAAIFTGGLVNNALRLARNQNKLNTDSLRQEIQRLAKQRRPQPKFTIKVQMKAKAKYATTLKHLKGIKRSATLTSSSPSTSGLKLSLLSPSLNLEKPREAKELHNYMERQRRNELRNAYEFLKKYVPSVANTDRASKQMILDKAIEHCHTVTTKEEAMSKQRQALYEKKIALQKRIMQLQRQNSLQQ